MVQTTYLGTLDTRLLLFCKRDAGGYDVHFGQDVEKMEEMGGCTRLSEETGDCRH